MVRYESVHAIQLTDTTDPEARTKIKGAWAKHCASHGLIAQIDVLPAVNTLIIGTKALAQLHNPERADRLLLGLNCAPPNPKQKKDTEGGMYARRARLAAPPALEENSNVRKNFFYAVLSDNAFTGGTNNGLELSYIKHASPGSIRALFEDVTTNDNNEKFRSLTVLPRQLPAFSIEEERNALIKRGVLVERDPDVEIPYVPDVTHATLIDNFGNVWTHFSKADLERIVKVSKVSFAFGEIRQSDKTYSPASVEFDRSPRFAEWFEAVVRPTLFGDRGTVLTWNSTDLPGVGEKSPMIGDVRDRPAETLPGYKLPLPGQPIKFNFGV